MESTIAALLFLLILFPSSPTNPPPPSSSSSSSSSRSSSFSELSTCLLSSGVHNFTHMENSHLFPHLLNFSIQNLRFSHPHPPPQPAIASIIILPHDLPSLQSSIICCRASSLTIRLRSGGHSYEGLSYLAPNHSSSIALLDLMNLDHIDVDVAEKSAWLQSGATLGQLYHAIAAAAGASSQPLAFSAGSRPTVGPGGHIAGGGFGLLSRKYGLAADNVLDAILIAPDGRILDREAMGKELFWAIRGGGGGTWGAVYAWKIQLQTVPNRVSAFIVNRSGSNREVAELIDVWQKVAPALPDEFYVSCFVGGSLPESTGFGISVTFKGLYLGPVREARSIMAARFRELNLLDREVREMSWIESVVYFSGLKNGSSVEDLLDRKLHTKTFFKAKSDYVQAHIDVEDLTKMVNMLSMEPKAYLIMDPYGGSMARRRIDDLPFPHRSKNLYAIQHLIEWTRADDGGREGYIQWIGEWYEFMGPMVSREPRAAYVNYLDLDLGHMGGGSDCMGCEDHVEKAREWGERYFLGNYDRLVRVKTIVDPDNVFWNEQSIPPLTLSQRLVGHGMV
ncbi:reticuline oxidase-like [Phalaenopsis equestris]|uniref:reticuline oxidase-like n=1 Tax=Phalaenopsis equestris TaxID=78828 RepID=UPI0009E4E996|nr:reticuline oxidase-like [Phalaenopsis equestris]